MHTSNHNQLSFRSIEVFIAVIEERSITGAAKRIGCSASTISNQLAKLETAMGAKLIHRSAQFFELTSAGHLFASRAQSILDEVTAAKADFSHKGHTPKMHLRIAVIEDFDRAVLPVWLKLTKDNYPHCTFDIQSGTSHESHAALYSRGVDMIVAADNTKYIDGVDEYPILNDPFLLVTNKNIDNAQTIQHLIDQPFVRYSREQLLAQQIEAQLSRSRVKPAQSFECTTTQAVFALVQKFNGWTITTASAALGTLQNEDRLSSTLNSSQLPLPKFSRTVSLYCRSGALGDMPQTIAGYLKAALSDTFIPKTQSTLPFLANRVEVIKDSNK